MFKVDTSNGMLVMKSSLKLASYIVIILLLLSCTKKTSQEEAQDTVTSLMTKNAVLFTEARTSQNFPLYIEALKQYAKLNGISDNIINIAFKDVEYIERVVKADRNQPENKITLNDYLYKVVSVQRVQLAKNKFTQFYPQLTQATKLTGVPQTYILALWGGESGYGIYQGSEDIISALATLSFDGRREAFFNKELLAALKILDRGYISKDRFKGSWAGAMGQNQFMPSSYLAYSKDGDGDGIIDIWTNMADIFASTGNYLATIGWNAGESWGNKVNLPKLFDLSQEGLGADKGKTIAQWVKLGVVIADSKKIPATDNLAWIIIPDDDPNKAYLVYNNFKTIMHWNRSYYFALSVGMLADNLDVLNASLAK